MRILKGIAAFLVSAGGGFLMLLDMIGRGQVALDLPDSLDRVAEFLAKHQEIGWQTLPWALMFGGLYYLASLRWPVLVGTPRPTPIRVSEKEVAALPIADDTLDLAAWTGHPTYTVWAASCLWSNEKPVPKIDQDHPAYPTLQMIKGHLETKVIQSLHGDSGMTAKLTRNELIKLANIRLERPAFLFPQAPSLERLQEEAHLAHGFDPGSPDARKAAILLLARLRSKGVDLRNEAGDVVDATLDDWTSRIHGWMTAVIDALALVDDADAELFRTLDVIAPARVAFQLKVINPNSVQNFIHQFRMHDLRVSRLGDFLQKYQGVTFSS